MFRKFALILALGLMFAIVLESRAQTCPCPRSFDPICASNGESYDNECQFLCAQLEAGGTLYVKWHGYCDEPPVEGL